MSDPSPAPQVEPPPSALDRCRTLGRISASVFASLTLAGVLFAIHDICRLGWFTYHEHVDYAMGPFHLPAVVRFKGW